MNDIGRLTPEKILARMTPGIAYTCADLGKKLKTMTYLVKAMLLKLEVAGRVVTTTRYDGTKCYAISGTPVVEEVPCSKATPLIPHLMTGELSGWEASLIRHRSLCMSIRRSS